MGLRRGLAGLVFIMLLIGSACQAAPAASPASSITPLPATSTETPTPAPSPTLAPSGVMAIASTTPSPVPPSQRPPLPPPAGTATPAGQLVPTPSPKDALPLTYRIQIPQIGVDTQLIPVGLDAEGAMASPEDPYKVGWFWPGAKPGSQGNLLISGHLDWMDWAAGVPRTGIFWRLRELAPGAQIIISDGSTQWTYVVQSSLKYRYDDPEAIALLQPTSDTRATLITCEGPGFDPVRRNYTYRRILLANLVETTSLP